MNTTTIFGGLCTCWLNGSICPLHSPGTCTSSPNTWLNTQPPIRPPKDTKSEHKQGWECPRCNAVMAPHAIVCVNCTGIKK